MKEITDKTVISETFMNAVAFLEERGYVLIPGSHKLIPEYSVKEILDIFLDGGFDPEYRHLKIELAPKGWPQLSVYPKVVMEDTPYEGLMFRLHIEESEKDKYDGHIYEFPLFSNVISLLRLDNRLTPLESFRDYVQMQEEKMRQHFAGSV